jgi:CP family cyanate transporter-like MFS transporter
VISQPPPSRRGSSTALLALGIVLVAINLRPAAASMGPVLGRIESGTGVSSGWAGVLTTLPVLCFGLLAPVAPILARRVGLRSSIAVSMLALFGGMLLRLVPGTAPLFAGTALAGAGIASGNVLLPVLIRRDFPHRTGTAMALYTASLVGFAALAAGVTVPIADALGGGWRPGLAVWALPAGIAALAWLPALRRRDVAAASSQSATVDPPLSSVAVASDSDRGRGSAEGARTLIRRPLAWQVTLFFALQSGGFYATLAWLPSIFRSHGASEAHAGFLLSLSMLVGLVTALVVPGLAGRVRDQRGLIVLCCVLTGAGLTGILVAPMSAPYLWTVLLGLGQNASFPLALMLIVLRGGNVATTEGLSTLSQSVGYVLAAMAPLAVGALHGATHSWTPALILLLALLVPMLLIGLPAGRDRVIGDSAPIQPGSDPPRSGAAGSAQAAADQGVRTTTV